MLDYDVGIVDYNVGLVDYNVGMVDYNIGLVDYDVGKVCLSVCLSGDGDVKIVYFMLKEFFELHVLRHKTNIS